MSQKIQSNWYSDDTGFPLSGLEMDMITNEVVSPMPWSRWDGDSSFSLDDESFLLEALSHLTDEEYESAPSSPSSSCHSSPSLLPQPQQPQQKLPTSTSRPKVMRSLTGKRFCQQLGCTKIDRGYGLCAAHGGGKRCSAELCTKASRKRGLCTSHFRINYK